MSELILKEEALNCLRDWIDRYGYEHTADEDTTYQLIEALDAVRCCDEDCISRRVVIEAIDDIESEVADGFGFQYEKWRKYFCELPAVQPDHVADISKKVEGDCISRQAAIDAMKDALDPHIVQFVKSKMAIEALPSAQPEPHWIPCSERLPENEYVLISKKQTMISGDKWSVAIAIRMADPRSGKIQWRDIGFGVIQDDKVLAWMPLPASYKGE